MRLPEIGTMLLRPVRAGEVKDVMPDETEKGSLLIRATQIHELRTKDLEEWVVVPPDKTGVVCFCHKDIPGDWIYLEVKGHSKNKNCVFVEPVVGSRQDLLDKYQE